MSYRKYVYGLVFILMCSFAYSLQYSKKLEFYDGDNAKIIKQDYFQRYIDYQLEKINSTTYALHWVNNNQWLLKNLTSKSESVKNTDFEAYSRYAFPEKNHVLVADDARYIKIKDEFPQETIMGNARIRGKVKPISQRQGTIYIDYDPHTYSLIKIGFGTLLIEFTTAEQSLQENLGFNNGYYRNVSRYIKIPYLASIKNATVNVYGLERNYSIWSEFDYFENAAYNNEFWNYSLISGNAACYYEATIVSNTQLKLDTACGGTGSPQSANAILAANNSKSYGYVNISRKDMSIYVKYSAYVTCLSGGGTDSASGSAYISLYNNTDTLTIFSYVVNCFASQTKNTNTGIKYINMVFNSSTNNVTVYDENGAYIKQVNYSSLGGNRYLYLRAASGSNRLMYGAAGSGQLNVYDIGQSYNATEYNLFNITSTYPDKFEFMVGDDIAYRNTTNLTSTSFKIDFATNLTNAMNGSSCDCTGCYIQNDYCYVPIIAKSDHGGGINISNISIDYLYDYNITLIDEIDNVVFNVSNLSICKAYWDDNSTAYDFKAAGNVSNFQFQAALGSKIRIELGYYGTSIINRYIDVSLFNTSIRVCANKDDVTHYEQRLQSNIERKAMLKSQYSNCYVVADYTRFARENLLEVRTFTIDRPYNLYTDISGVHTLISSLDGGVPDNTNIDTLEFALDDYTISILQPTLSFKKIEGIDNTIQILYKNSKEDNDNLRIKITNTDNGDVAFNGNTFADPNDVTLNFDYGVINYTNNTLFKIVVTANENSETESTITRWFTTNLNVGIIKAEFGMIATIMLMLFGFTIIRSKDTLGWFGLTVSLTNIAILSLCITTWYTTFMMAIYIVIGLFTLVLLFTGNKTATVVS